MSRVGQVVGEARHSRFGSGPVLGTDIDAARGIFADEHGGKARRAADPPLELGDVRRRSLADRGCDGLSVDQPRRHAPP